MSKKFTGTVTIDINQFMQLNNVAEDYTVMQEEIDTLRYENRALRNTLLQRLFKRHTMSYNTREEQVSLYQDGTPKYTFGYTDEDIALLKTLGFTMDDLIKYINDQWDSKEAEMLGEPNGEDEEE